MPGANYNFGGKFHCVRWQSHLFAREQAVTQKKTLVLICCLFAVVVAWNLLSPVRNASAQPVKVGQKWAYATLSYEDPIGPEFGSIATWITGKKILGARWKKEAQTHPFSKINKDLGGKEEHASLGVLLDRIGQDGWELVSHTSTEGPRRITQTWTFKRPVQ
jgi:hypothetical protein